MRNVSPSTSLATITLVLLAGCGKSCWLGGSGFDTHEPPIVVDDSGDTEPPPPHGVHGAINGHVSVTLVWEDETGQLEEIPWEESCFGDTFPFGQIFVTAYTVDEETGAEAFFGDNLITDPQVDPGENVYSIAVDTDTVEEVYLYAAMDKWGDRIIGPSDPVGFYPDTVQVVDGEIVNDVDIEILTSYWCGYEGTGAGYGDCPDCPSGWGNCYYWDGTQWVYIPGCGGGGCDTYVSVGGPLTISVPYNGTGHDVATILLNGWGEPWSVHYDIAVAATADGAEGTWSHTYCTGSGTYEALGCWDRNRNGIYDPADLWGQPVTADGEPLGTVTFGESDDLGTTMLIPLEGSGIDVVPFVRLSGEVVMGEGTWADLVDGYPDAKVYIVAAKYRPAGDMDDSELMQTYDYDVWEAGDLASADTLPFTLLAPSNTTLYLWASADLDADGVINGHDEGFAGYSGDSHITTGETSMSGIVMEYGFF
ncbi:MAG: hypothetical protein ABIO70_13675 [Pseudomonadota bacterium]